MLYTDLVQPITQRDALLALAAELQRHSIIAVDTESNSLYAFRERVCLVQFSAGEKDWLVDPLALGDLSPLGPLFSDPAIEKVFHAAEYDVLCLKRDFGFQFASLFDTLTAARILGRKEVGLGSILAAEFGVEQDKRHQRANWGIRPLPPELLHYAVQDTRYLIPLRRRLAEALQEKGLWELAQEDFQRVYLVENHAAEEEAAWWRVPHASELTPQQAAVLQELCRYRDSVARLLDRPRFKVMGSETLFALAQNCPGRLEDLRGLPGMTQPQVRRHGRAILQAVARGLEAEPLDFPKPRRPDERYLQRLDRLREWRKAKGRELGVESDVVLPKDLVHALAEAAPRDAQSLAIVMQTAPWRLEHWGDEILRILRK
jgi:ribonuclease D